MLSVFYDKDLRERNVISFTRGCFASHILGYMNSTENFRRLAVIICKTRLAELRVERLPFPEIPAQCIQRQHVLIFSVICHALIVENLQSFPAVKV